MVTKTTGLNNSYDTLLTSKLRTWLRANPIEQAALGNAFFDRVYMTNKHTLNAASEYTVPVSFVETAKGGYYDGAGVTNTEGSDDVTIARYDHFSLTEPIKLFRTDKKKSAQGQFELLAHKLGQARLRMRNKMDLDLQAASKITNGPETLQLAIAESPDGTEFGGINSANNDGWTNNFIDTSAGFASNIDDWDEMSVLCNKFGLTQWDWINTTPAIERFLKAEARANQSIDVGFKPASGRFADSGYQGTAWEGKPVIGSRNSKAESAFFINDDALYFQVDPSDDFVLEGPFPLQPGGQHGDLWNLYLGGQLIVSERKALGVIFDITGA